MIDHKRKFIFVHIPKTGGITIHTALGVDKILLDKLGPEIHYDELTEDLCMDYFMFTFVRNPWDRIVSLFHYWFEQHPLKRKLRELPKDFNWFCNNLEYVFDQFLPQKEKVHILPQCRLNGNEKYIEHLDFIGRFETLEQDFRTVCRKIGIQPRKIERRNQSLHKHYIEYYNDTAREIIAKKYAEDIKRFGYTFEK